MRRVFLFVLVSLSLFGCGGGGGGDEQLQNSACQALGLSERSYRIINGTVCGGLEASPVVRVFLLGEGGGVEGFCSGTMIAPDAVLTAAHCLSMDPAAIAVVYGEPETAAAVPVREAIVHPGYQRVENPDVQAVFNDLAVLKLSQSLSHPVLPLAQSESPEVGDVLSIFGYGTDENGDFDGNYLRSGQVRASGVSRDHISAYYEGEGSNTCTGDSGGPLLMKIDGQPAIVGVTSTGTRNDCLAGDNSLFSSLQSDTALEFIRGIVPSVGTR